MTGRFPQEAVLRDGRRVLIRRFNALDVDALHEFFQRLPIDIRRTAWDNIEDRALVEAWGRNIDYSKALPLLAFDRDQIVADATLHRRQGGPLRRVGRIKWLIDPNYRGQGLGTTMVNDFINIARQEGLSHLTAMLLAESESDAIETLSELGFENMIIPGYGTDPDGDVRDMVKLIMKL